MGGLVSWRPKIGLILAVKASWVLALSAVLVFGFSLGARANPITNVTINGQPADDSQDNLSVPELGGNVILPGGASGLIPENNEVVVYGTVSPAFHGVIGGASLTANSVNNSLMVNGSGFINGTVLGGVASGTYNATDNRVVIDAIGGIFQNLGSLSNSGNVFGGYVMNGTAKNNLVTIFNGNVSAKVVGGATRYNGQVLSNQVVINGLGVKVGSVYGGQSLDSGRVENNVVTILNGSVQGDAIGGDLANSNGLVNNNAVFLYNGSIGGNIYGGYNHLAPTAVLTNVTNNQVIIHGGAVNHNIIGGEAFYGPADYNTVHLDNVTAAVQTSRSNTNIYGGLSQTWSATGNQVIIKRMANLLQVRQIFGGETKTDGNVAENLVNVATVNATGITGGQTYLGDAIHNQVRVEDSLASTIMGGVSQEGDVTNNSVVVVNSTLSGSAGMVAGGYSTNGTVVSNAAYLRNVTVVNSVTGGAVGGYSSLNGDVNNNKIVVSDSKISGKGVIGGYSTKGSVANSLAEVIASSVTNVSGGYVSLKGAVNNSSSKVVASNVSGTVYGGYSANGSIAKGATTVTDSNVTGNVYGGYTEEGPVADSSAIIIASEALNVGGGYSASGPVINGQVGVIESDIRGNVSGGYAEDGPVTNGKATVADSNVTGNIYGGYAEDGPVLDSLAWIESSNASNVYGGYAE
ncbi:MAG: hypothetical protein LBS60_03400, partial [Deltaproteobacteria bacterium]|nr:hypothetical protein [Deltaproteobacteria bacterium]